MSQIVIKIEGLEEFQQKLRIAKAEVRRAVEKAVSKSAFRIQLASKKRIQRGPKTGKIYDKYEPRRTHQASAPDEPPASDTGRLAGSIQVKEAGLDAYVYSVVSYAPFLEFGTEDIAPRPFLLPSVEEDADKLLKELKEIFK